MRQFNIKTPLVFKIGVALLCAMLITSYMMSGLYARYTVTATASDSARVAKFSITDDLADVSKTVVLNASSIGPGEQYYYAANIINNSEVTVHYKVMLVNMTDNLPITDAILNEGDLAPGVNESPVISIRWDSVDVSADYAGKTDVIKIIVTVEQVD